MSTFKFNFSNDENKQGREANSKEVTTWLECEEVIPNKPIVNIGDLVIHAKMFACGDVEIGHVLVSEALNKMYTGDGQFKNAVELADKEHSDLVAGIYEGAIFSTSILIRIKSFEFPGGAGRDHRFRLAMILTHYLGLTSTPKCGLKIWECTYDLINYLESTDRTFDNKRVLDLGCGAGILGIYTFLKGAYVTFQDYNKEILECVTIPNVLLNIEEDGKTRDICKCNFFSGDWASFNNKLADTDVFDFILTSETIYNTTNYNKLIDLFAKRLSQEGAVFVAAKNCYFGVGGGTRQFETSVEKNGFLKSEVCWKSSGGILREILKFTKKS